MTSTTPLVELRNVSFGYGERVILRDVSLQVPRGKVTALMGASGGGKTTVLRLIGGQQRAQAGQVLFDGQDVGQLGTHGLYAMRRRMGMLFQFGLRSKNRGLGAIAASLAACSADSSEACARK